MELGMIGLGRMGANMVVRLMKDGHDCHVYDTHADAVKQLTHKGAKGSTNLARSWGSYSRSASWKTMRSPQASSMPVLTAAPLPWLWSW